MKQFFFIDLAIITVALLTLTGCEHDDVLEKEQAGGIPDGVEAVDLGLSVKWASFNLGADSIEGCGDYYAWGETSTKSRHTWENYLLRATGSYYEDDITYTKYNTSSKRGSVDNKILIEESDDVAHVKWGGSWRLPTQMEFSELLDTNNCTWTWVNRKGVYGFKVTSKRIGFTDQSIFLPATGISDAYYNPYKVNSNYGCMYMSGSLSEENPDNVWYLGFRHEYPSLDNDMYRCIGQSVRPVCTSDSWKGITSITIEKDTLVLLADSDSNDFGEEAVKYQMMSDNVVYDYYKKFVTWNSGDESVAIVDSNGRIRAISEGNTTVTASYNGINASCSVIVVGINYDNTGYENEYGYVDLGLSVKWASMNVGASQKDDYGNYYAWGETEPQTGYKWSTYRFWLSGELGRDLKFSKYYLGEGGDNKTTLEPEDDAARVQWKGNWRIPTSDELNEIIDNCNWKWITRNGVNGFRVSSLKSGFEGNSIFLPAAGYRYSNFPIDENTFGEYWSRSLDSQSHSVRILLISRTNHSVEAMSRCYGMPVRAVCP